MKQFPDDVQNLLNSPEATKLLKNKDALASLSQHPQVQSLMETLNAKSGGNLKSLAEAAMKGDATKLSQLVKTVKDTPEAAKAVSDLSRNLPK